MSGRKYKVKEWQADENRLLAYQVIDEFVMPQRVKNYRTGKMETKMCCLGRGVRWIIKYAFSCEVYGMDVVHPSDQYLVQKYNKDMENESVKGNADVRDIKNWISLAKRTGILTTAHRGKRRTLEINMVFLKEKMIETKLRDLAGQKIREARRLELEQELNHAVKSYKLIENEDISESLQMPNKCSLDVKQMQLKCNLNENEGQITSVVSSPNGNGGGDGNGNGLYYTDGQPPKKHTKRRRFTPPTVQEVEAYCKEKGYDIDPDFFVEYYESSDWHDKNGVPVRSWKQRVVTWVKHNRQSLKQPSPSGEIEQDKDSSSVVERENSSELAVLQSPAFQIWAEVMGVPLSTTRVNDEAGQILLRKCKGEDGLRKVLRACLKAKQDPKADFRARNIANLSDLQKNWDYVIDWARQQVGKQSKPGIVDINQY